MDRGQLQNLIKLTEGNQEFTVGIKDQVIQWKDDGEDKATGVEVTEIEYRDGRFFALAQVHGSQVPPRHLPLAVGPGRFAHRMMHHRFGTKSVPVTYSAESKAWQEVD